MPLQKLQFRPGLNREGTDYSNEGGWYDGDKIRFRSGFPEKIGGWQQVSPNQFNGVCRSLWVWLDGDAGVGSQYIGVGTNTKYYIYFGGTYNDITPYIYTSSPKLNNPFATSYPTNPYTVTVTDAQYSPSVGDYVVFSGATTFNGVTINGEYQIQSVINSSTYTITSTTAATSAGSGGGANVVASYEYPAGLNVYSIGTGWGAGPWGGVASLVTYTLGANPFATINTSGTVTVTQTAHGYTTNAGSFVVGREYRITSIGSTDFTLIGAASNTVGITFFATGVGTGSGTASVPYVLFSGSTAVNGIPAALINTAVAITVTGTGTYTFITNANSPAYPATSTGSGGGSAVVVTPQQGNQGWGDSFSSGIGQQLRLWSNDNYGFDLVIAPRGGPISYWADSGTVSQRAKLLSSIANSTTEFTDAITFLNAATSITVSAANAPNVYPYMYITGTNLLPNTQVSGSYITGNTTVPITTVTLGPNATSEQYTFSYDGSFIPNQTYQVIASAIQEFIIAYGSCPYVPNVASGTGISTFNPMIVRWSDQGNAYQWIPKVTNQSGEFLLTNGSFIMGARATRQEILVWTDSCLYSQQYLGAPYVWGFQVLMDNITIMSPNCMITVNNVTYWMGKDRFYMYSGRVEVLPCALRQYIFGDINQNQAYQVFAGGNEAYNEVWWFYVSTSSADFSIDRYVIYNYLDRVWYYGTWNATKVTAGTFVVGKQYVIASTGTTNFTLIGAANNDVGTYFIATGAGSGTGQAWTLAGRTAWIQTGTQPYPIAADYNGRLLYHEVGNDDLSTSTTYPIDAYVQSSDFDIGDGHNFGFVWRILPDVNFNGSSINQPSVTMTVKPRQNSGTPYGQADNPQVQSAQNYTNVPAYTVQLFDGQVYTRLRGRQMSFRIESDGIGVAWQLGSPRIDIRPDGRR